MYVYSMAIIRARCYVYSVPSKLKSVQGEVKDKVMSTMFKVMHSFRTGSSF